MLLLSQFERDLSKESGKNLEKIFSSSPKLKVREEYNTRFLPNF